METQTNLALLYLADRDISGFRERAEFIDIVCVGDSITGWNNVYDGSTEVESGPYPTYPQYLQELTDLSVVDCGISGTFSFQGPLHVADCLNNFPKSKYFVIGYGTNDLGAGMPAEFVSRNILRSLDRVTQSVLSAQKIPFLMNVPHLNSRRFGKSAYQRARQERDFHNQHLMEFCSQRNIKLADICSLLIDDDFEDALHPNEQGARKIAQAVHALF